MFYNHSSKIKINFKIKVKIIAYNTLCIKQ